MWLSLVLIWVSSLSGSHVSVGGLWIYGRPTPFILCPSSSYTSTLCMSERLTISIAYCDKFGSLTDPQLFTPRWTTPMIRVDFEVEYLLNMDPWSVEWEESHALIYELCEENTIMPLMVYGERYWAYAREILHMSTYAWEIIERLGMDGLGKLVNREAVYLKGQLQEMTRSRDQAIT
ncbi:hypothetical protein AMTR_s00117p00100540 [Amborella trichopoda]|uniref:Uncharacterized protein n=1 Tax=Amborella trichopoda TaxID=13333 RepID=W1NSX1_AMBTC|nr:hypothetical protein AMTR_s00117p00100540 [Amborella trichopoda]